MPLSVEAVGKRPSQCTHGDACGESQKTPAPPGRVNRRGGIGASRGGGEPPVRGFSFGSVSLPADPRGRALSRLSRGGGGTS
jgi:hypothetical protein